MYMKKVLFTCFLIVIIAACSKTPEENAKEMIKERVKNMLYHPESYEAVDTRFDSIFTVFGEPSFYEQTLKVYKIGEEIQRVTRDIKEAKSDMALRENRVYQTEYSRNQYEESKEKYESLLVKKEKLEAKVSKGVGELKVQLKAKPKFRGYFVLHHYRAKDDGGMTSFGDFAFIFNKELNKIVYIYNIDDNDFKRVMLLYKLMQGNDIELNEDKWLVDEDMWDSIWNKEE